MTLNHNVTNHELQSHDQIQKFKNIFSNISVVTGTKWKKRKQHGKNGKREKHRKKGTGRKAEGKKGKRVKGEMGKR